MAGTCLGLSTRNSEQWRNAILAGWLAGYFYLPMGEEGLYHGIQRYTDGIFL